jgi:hypothetical protein
MNVKKLSQLKKGASVRLTKACEKFYSTEAFSLCTIGGVLNNMKHADDFFILRALGMKLPYKATLVIVQPDVVGDTVPEPGARICIQVGSLTTETIVSHKDLV